MFTKRMGAWFAATLLALTATATRAEDLVETAVSAGDFKTLVAAVKAAGLAETLQGAGPYTVFAPSDDAFKKIPKETLNRLLQPENKAQLANILTFHVVSGRVMATDAMKLSTATTLNGQRLDLQTSEDGLTINGAGLLATDIECDNGVIHVIDQVLMPRATAASAGDDATVQLAILLDTSGSMDGLVDQARCQVWTLIDEIASARRNGSKAQLEIAVLEYGNSRTQKTRGYVRRVLDFSGDLDEVSRALFSLTLKGGDEFCGEAIRQACDDLEWKTDAAYQAIFIAGNEPFDQGETQFASVLPRLAEKGIPVNSIYCRWKDAKPDEDRQWDLASQRSGGVFGAIDHNHQLAMTETPFDGEFRVLNKRMNETFLWYGKDAEKSRRNQLEQDRNSQKMSNDVFAQRMSAKIGHLYRHDHADLVDAVHHGSVDLSQMSEDEMPATLRAMATSERAAHVTKMIESRERVRREMASLIAKRHEWLKGKMSEQLTEGEDDPATWGDAFVKAIRQQLIQRGFELQMKVASK